MFSLGEWQAAAEAGSGPLAPPSRRDSRPGVSAEQAVEVRTLLQSSDSLPDERQPGRLLDA